MKGKNLEEKILLGIAGLSGSGKTTIADYLVDKYSMHQKAFADPIKKMLSVQLRVPESYLNNPRLKDQPIPHMGCSGRVLMQRFGAAGRAANPDLWVLRMEERLNRNLCEARVVVSDIRFENEAALIRRLGGVVLHVRRLGDTRPMDMDESEQGVFIRPGDWAMTNDKSAGRVELYRFVDKFMKRAFRKREGEAKSESGMCLVHIRNPSSLEPLRKKFREKRMDAEGSNPCPDESGASSGAGVGENLNPNERKI